MTPLSAAARLLRLGDALLQARLTIIDQEATISRLRARCHDLESRLERAYTPPRPVADLRREIEERL